MGTEKQKDEKGSSGSQILTVVLSVSCVLVLLLIIACIIAIKQNYNQQQYNEQVMSTESVEQVTSEADEESSEELLSSVDSELAERVAATFIDAINNGDMETLLILLPEQWRGNEDIQNALSKKVDSNVAQDIEINFDSLKCSAGKAYTDAGAEKYGATALIDVTVSYDFTANGKQYHKSEIINTGRFDDNWYYLDTQNESSFER